MTVALMAAAVAALGVRAVLIPAEWAPGDPWGLTFGGAAAALMLLAALYPARRRWAIGPLQTAQAWLQLHVYGGALAGVLVLVHVGFRLPHGWFGWLLVALSTWVTVSGLAGVLLQKAIPPLLTDRLRVEAIYERIPSLVEQLREQARDVIAGAPDVLRRFHASEVEPLLASVTPSWSPFAIAARRPMRSEVFEEATSFVSDAGDRQRVQELERIVTTKLELDAHYSAQRLLRLWPLLHVPAAIALTGAILAHVAAVLYF